MWLRRRFSRWSLSPSLMRKGWINGGRRLSLERRPNLTHCLPWWWWGWLVSLVATSLPLGMEGVALKQLLVWRVRRKCWCMSAVTQELATCPSLPDLDRISALFLPHSAAWRGSGPSNQLLPGATNTTNSKQIPVRRPTSSCRKLVSVRGWNPLIS